MQIIETQFVRQLTCEYEKRSGEIEARKTKRRI